MSDKKTATISFRCHEDIKKGIEESAKNNNQNVSNYLITLHENSGDFGNTSHKIKILIHELHTLLNRLDDGIITKKVFIKKARKELKNVDTEIF